MIWGSAQLLCNLGLLLPSLSYFQVVLVPHYFTNIFPIALLALAPKFGHWWEAEARVFDLCTGSFVKVIRLGLRNLFHFSLGVGAMDTQSMGWPLHGVSKHH